MPDASAIQLATRASGRELPGFPGGHTLLSDQLLGPGDMSRHRPWGLTPMSRASPNAEKPQTRGKRGPSTEVLATKPGLWEGGTSFLCQKPKQKTLEGVHQSVHVLKGSE